MVAGRASDEGSEAGVLEILEAVDWRGQPKNSAEKFAPQALIYHGEAVSIFGLGVGASPVAAFYGAGVLKNFWISALLAASDFTVSTLSFTGSTRNC